MAPSRLLLLASQLLLLLGFSQPYFLTNCSLSHGSSPVWAVAVDCGGRQLLSVPADLPPGTTSLFFSYNWLQAVSRLDFRSMRRLRRLVLSYNRIARVEQGSFLHQGALETLDLSYNLLCNLTENMFQGLSNLTRLDLSSNQIRVLHPTVFRLLTSVHTVLLESNLLRRVEDVQPLLLLPNIHSLKLASNLFTSFQSSDLPLTQSSALETLDLSSCRLLESFGITTPVFPRLRCLDLSMSGVQSGLRWDVTNRTFLRSVSQLSFNQPLLPLDNVLHVLQSLDSLAEVQLNYVEDWIRGGLLDTLCLIPTLRTLVLVYNHLGRSTLGLARCSQLSILDLSWTYLRTLPEGSVRPMKRLKVLRLQTNFLTEVPKDVGRLVSLRTLDLNDNLISELRCGDFGDAAGLTDLDLGTNRIAKLDGCAFQNLTRLRTLDLSHNLLWTYDGTFRTGLQSLERLDLSRGFLFILHNGDFQGLRSLRYLDVSSDHIGRVQQKAFGGLKDLETLTVSIPLDYECNFRGLRRLRNLTVYLSTDRGQTRLPRASPQVLYELRSLKTFTVVCRGFHFGIPLEPPEELLQTMPGLEAFAAINAFTSAPRPDTFRCLPRLQNLTLGKTDLSDLEPELFHFVPDLQTLDLSETSLRSLDFLSGADLFRLRSLSLRDNRLVTVNHTVLRSLPALVQLDLTGNPFACDCSNAAFIEWAKTNNQTQVVNAHEYGCAFPPSRHGARLMDFDTQSCFLDLGLVCFASSGALVVLTLLASFVHHFLRWQMLYAYRLFLAFLYDRRRKRAGPERYDAFVSYNVHDEDWVYRHLLPELEGRQGWRLCLHHRDFQPGRPILENITDAIYSSRKTLCVVSRRYLQSEWCSREVQMASFRLFDEQKDVLVLLFLEDIPSRYLSPYHRMRRLVKRRTYLSWTQAASHPGLFWDNVRRALETGDGPGQEALLTGVPDPRQGPE